MPWLLNPGLLPPSPIKQDRPMYEKALILLLSWTQPYDSKALSFRSPLRLHLPGSLLHFTPLHSNLQPHALRQTYAPSPLNFLGPHLPSIYRNCYNLSDWPPCSIKLISSTIPVFSILLLLPPPAFYPRSFMILLKETFPDRLIPRLPHTVARFVDYTKAPAEGPNWGPAFSLPLVAS